MLLCLGALMIVCCHVYILWGSHAHLLVCLNTHMFRHFYDYMIVCSNCLIIAYSHALIFTCLISTHMCTNLDDDMSIAFITTPSQLCRYCPLWSPYSSWFCSSPGCTGEKASTHWREIIPYKHILMCFPRRCGIPWNVRPHFWVTTIHPPYGHTRPRVWGPHFRLGHGSDTICNDPTPTV